MNSSESEEDFESADEEPSFDHTTTLKDDKELLKPSVNTSNIKNKVNDSGLTDLHLLDVKQKLEDFSLGSKETSKEIISKNTSATISENACGEKAEEIKVKSSAKKLGTKINAASVEPAIFKENPCEVINQQHDENKEDTKVQPESLEKEFITNPEIIGSDNKNNVLIEYDSENQITGDARKEINKDISEEMHVTQGERGLSKNIPFNEEINYEAGDGWEIEEEDGFEIPVSLTKMSDGGIQCAQEHVALDQVQFKSSNEDHNQGWGGWGGWGVSSLLSETVSQVTTGLSTVLETTVGTSDPNNIAIDHTKGDSVKPEDQINPGYVGLGSIVSGVSFLGSTVINRGLDTLETIGKKTMEVLQEGDPGLKKKRALLFQNQEKPILSQILREAKEKADNSDKEKEEKESARKVHFESLFDDFQGMVHLEALEMLSTQCELKLQSMLQSQTGAQLLDLQETLSQVQDLCELGEEEEDSEVITSEQFSVKVTNRIENLRISMKPTKIIQVNSEIYNRLEKLALEIESATLVSELAISSLAELTAAAMEYFHKSAELLLAKSIRNTTDEADSYVQLTSLLCLRVSIVANEFTQLLTKHNPISNSSKITNIFLEASNSCSYIKNACQLLVPIIQVGAVS